MWLWLEVIKVHRNGASMGVNCAGLMGQSFINGRGVSVVTDITKNRKNWSLFCIPLNRYLI